MKRYLLFFVILAFCGQVSAQNKVAELIHKGLELMDSMAVKGIDRSYIDIPDRPWQIVVKNNMNQSVVKMKTSGEAGGMP